MKFLLILHICSFVSQTCPGMLQPAGVYNSWHECAMDGYKKGGEYIANAPKEQVNRHKIAVKFECKPIDPA